MYKIFITFIIFFLSLVINVSCAEKLLKDGNAILKFSDTQFIPYSSIYSIDINSKRFDSAKQYLIKGYKRGQNDNLLIVQEPSSLKEIVHLRKENNIWTYYPSIGKTIRMAYQSVFMDTTLSYGDIISTELTRDYQAKLIGIEKINNKDAYKLELSPKDGTIGYAKIMCWIDTQTLFPIKREFYSLSDIIMKTCFFVEIKMNESSVYSVTQKYIEPLKNSETIVKFFDIYIKNDLNPNLFNPNSLKYLKAE